MIFLNRIFDGAAFLLPLGHQFIDAAGIHHGAGDNVRADLLAFIQDSDRRVFIQCSKMIRSGETGRAPADDQDIDIKALPFGHDLRIPREPFWETTVAAVYDRRYSCYPWYFLKSRDALVPPNPKEFDNAYRTSAF